MIGGPMPAIKTRTPVFIALLDEAAKTMHQAPAWSLELELYATLGLVEDYASIDEDDTEIAPLAELGKRRR
jgi:hypothetical protein